MHSCLNHKSNNHTETRRKIKVQGSIPTMNVQSGIDKTF